MIIESKLQPKQKQAARYWLDDETEELLYGGAKYGAKTYLGCSLVFGDALTYPGTHYFIARHNLIDLKKFTTPSIYEVLGHWGIDPLKYLKYNGQENYFDIYNGSRVYYMDCKYLPSDPEFHRFGSLQFTRGWLEEIGQIHSLAIINLSASVGRWKNKEYKLKRKVLSTCNPNKGYAYNEFYLPAKKKKLPKHKKFVRALPTDNKYLTPDYLAALDRLPENERQRLRLGNWEYDSDPTTLIDYDTIENMYSNEFVPEGDKYIISDIARFGSDKAIITVWSGLILIDRVSFPMSAMTEVENSIRALMIKYKVGLSNVLVDEDGIGGGVKDHLHCKGFVAQRRAKNKIYYNNKTECGYKLAELATDIHIKCELEPTEIETINQELGMLKTYESDKDSKLRILPKEKIKDHIGRSPDWLDCFTMRMWYEIHSGRYVVQ
jgi:phage terminase large subunit